MKIRTPGQQLTSIPEALNPIIGGSRNFIVQSEKIGKYIKIDYNFFLIPPSPLARKRICTDKLM